jgi:UDP-N-acetylmuramate--alanine ligase
MPKTINHIHIIGVGGIGTSALAQYYLAQGKVVSGSDVASSEITDFLKSKGVKIYIEHSPENICGAQLVIHSAAVGNGNEEYDAAKRDRIPTKLYAEAVGEITQQYMTIAISGSHGKSTTTAMVAKILIDAGLDPTVIVGTKMHELGGNNFRMGKGKYLVLEADDYNRHFHNYHPTIAVVTNVDAEHLDVYRNLAGVKEAFVKFLESTKQGGTIIANGQDKNTVDVIKSADLLKYQVILFNETDLAIHDLGVVGDHNQSNAEAAFWVAKTLGVSEDKIKQSLAGFRGSWRRLEEIQEGLYTDYAHHPTEIKATLQALKQANPTKKLICVFQPHQRDRLNRLFDEFTTAFTAADELYLIPLYTARGRDSDVGEDSKSLAKLIAKPKTTFCENFTKAFKFIKPLLNDQHIVVFMGAGDIDERLRSQLS